MEAKSYSDINNLWKPSPGFATTIFISWSDIGQIFEVDKRWDLVEDGDPTPIDVMNIAFQEAQDWADRFRQSEGQSPDDEEMVEAENDIAKSIMDHWSYRSVLSSNVNFSSIVEGINQWCISGPKNKKLFVKPPTSQAGLHFFTNDSGINFTIYPSFMVPYTELYYRVYNNLPEWNLEDLDGPDIVETLFLYCAFIGKPINLELSQWDAKRDKY